jgi:hypothetical protein
VEGQYDQEEQITIEELSKKYPWWSLLTMVGKTIGAARKTEETASLFKSKGESASLFRSKNKMV